MTVFSSYKITSEATRKVVTVSSRGLLRQYSSDDSGRQRFRKLSSGKTQLASRAFNDATVVDAIGGDLTAPAYLQVYPSHGGMDHNRGGGLRTGPIRTQAVQHQGG